MGTLSAGLVKPLFSGFIVASVGCYFGMTAKGGTQGVGRATTQAVVFAMIFIILVDFLVTQTDDWNLRAANDGENGCGDISVAIMLRRDVGLMVEFRRRVDRL